MDIFPTITGTVLVTCSLREYFGALQMIWDTVRLRSAFQRKQRKLPIFARIRDRGMTQSESSVSRPTCSCMSVT